MRVDDETGASPHPQGSVAQPPDIGALLTNLCALVLRKLKRPLPLVAFTLAVEGWSLMWARALEVITFAPEWFFAAMLFAGLALSGLSQRRLRAHADTAPHSNGEALS